MVDAASAEGRDPVEDIYKINQELASYDPELAKRPQVIAANKMDALYAEDGEDPIQRLRDAFSSDGIEVFPISAVSGQGLKELLYYVQKMLNSLPKETTVFEEQEYDPEVHLKVENLPFTVEKSEERGKHLHCRRTAHRKNAWLHKS